MTQIELLVGWDYSTLINVLDGVEVIYNGGDSWTLRGRGREQTADAPQMTARVRAAVARVSSHVGGLR